MKFTKTKFRGVTITAEHLKGCYLNNLYYKPNGTGPEKMFGSRKAGRFIRKCLQSFKSDKWQKIASLAHDIIYKMGGTEKDRAFADKLMRKIAIAEVHADFAWYRPMRYIIDGRMWGNWIFVKAFGKDSFNFTYRVPNIKTVAEMELIRARNRKK